MISADGLPPGAQVRDRIEVNGAHYTAGQIEWLQKEVQQKEIEIKALRACLSMANEATERWISEAQRLLKVSEWSEKRRVAVVNQARKMRNA